MQVETQANVPEPEAGVTHLKVEDALGLAIHLHRLNELEEAEKLYRRVLEVSPEHPDALHFLGVLAHHRGRSEEAVDTIRRSIALAPDVADRYNNLGNVLVECGRAADAVEAYQNVLALRPDHADAWNNLGAALRALGRLDEAEAAFRRAIELDPKHVDACNNAGNLYSARGWLKEAIDFYCMAITLAPGHAESRRLLGIAYYTLGQIDAAARVFQNWLSDEPDNPVARHLHAACSGIDVPDRASDIYIESTFDSFAGTFDAKLGHLDYKAPELVAAAVERALGEPAGDLTALDAGCGTGLCGPLIASFVHHLTGVDLSAGMLDRARTRGVYGELVKAELTEYLSARRDAFDLIVSADTLVYFGPLDAVARAAAGAMRQGGIFAFTVEAVAEGDSGQGYRINPHGRYSHCHSYVARTLADAGLDVEAIESATLRQEGGAPVHGLVVTARKHADAPAVREAR